MSVVIPAHDEEATIGRTLGALLADAAPGQLEVVVVCNGCTDRTAERARSFDGVRVVETPVASKFRALNLGDEAATSFPRLYLDADVTMTASDVARLAERLAEGDVSAVAPHRRLDMTGVSRAVAAIYRIYGQLSVVNENLIGAGAYALSEEGRARFGPFPDLLSDDLYVSSLFAPHEKCRVPGAHSVVRPPATLRQLLRTKTRAYVGTRQLRDLGHRPATTSDRRWHHVVADDPRLVPAAVVYVAVAALAKARAAWRVRRGDYRTWDRAARHTGPSSMAAPEQVAEDARPTSEP